MASSCTEVVIVFQLEQLLVQLPSSSGCASLRAVTSVELQCGWCLVELHKSSECAPVGAVIGAATVHMVVVVLQWSCYICGASERQWLHVLQREWNYRLVFMLLKVVWL